MTDNLADRIKAIINRSGSAIPGLPEFNQVTPSKIVNDYFRANPKGYRYYLDKVSYAFNGGLKSLEMIQAKHDAEIRNLQRDHREAIEDETGEAPIIKAKIQQMEERFSNHYSRELNLTKGNALVIANRELESIESHLKQGERIQAQAIEDRYSKMSPEQVNVELLKELKQLRNEKRH